MDLELRALRSFVAVADALHFGRAATALRIAQPALSQQIRRLERDLGVELFTRTSRSVVLTPAGTVLHRRARSLLARAEMDVDEVVRVARGEQGRLDVGFVSSALPLGPVERVQQFRERFPLVQVHLTEGYTAWLTGRVLRGDLDLAVLRDPERVEGIRLSPFHEERFVAVVPTSHPLAGREQIRGTELAADPFVFFPAVAGSLATERNLAPVVADGRVPEIVQEATNWTTLLHLVAAGIGVTVAPVSAVLAAPPGVVVLELDDTDAHSVLAWASRTDDDRPALRAFVEGD
ncbi:LysR substrate-binding domain-containing protein [Curtobacterium sp. Leaf261]|uniref:LysR substrate-binding domain-containing protein n=1 Tax=Curtobacterium sp. Leaf261 TaxID=1736311 RepID=UPI0007003C2B|nr:LysR substrate-binding domain-containing protein [Curtobacterium sp. Leaf261]KQO63718.1 LysR family transcriptional regulator [Curtobacterium sp. Leaf261]